MLVGKSGLRTSVAAALLVAVGWASAAAAATPVAMMGRWFDRRGIATHIPIAKGGIPAGPTTFQPNLPDYINTLMTTGGTNMLFLTRSVAPPSPGALFRFPAGMLAKGAGAGGTKTAQQDGTSVGTAGNPPTKLTIEGKFWDVPAVPFLIPILAAPNVLDLFTTFYRGMPVVSGATTMGGFPGESAMLAAGSKTTRPANFTFCPNPNPVLGTGMTALSCVTPVPSPIGSGSRPGLVRYTAGPNQFGGVMNTVVQGSGYLHVIPATGVVTVGDPRPGQTGMTLMLAAKRPLGGTQPGPWGGPRQKQNLLDEDPAPLYGIVGTVFGGIVTSEIGQSDLDPGPGTNFAATPMNAFGVSALGQNSINWGFPVTTGTVTVSFDPASVTGPPDIMILRGSDMRTQMGKGTLTLVSGGMTNSIVNPGQNFSQGSVIVMVLPEAQAVLGAAGGLLALLGAHVAVRRRRNRA